MGSRQTKPRGSNEHHGMSQGSFSGIEGNDEVLRDAIEDETFIQDETTISRPNPQISPPATRKRKCEDLGAPEPKANTKTIAQRKIWPRPEISRKASKLSSSKGLIIFRSAYSLLEVLIDGINEELLFIKCYPPKENLKDTILNAVYLALALTSPSSITAEYLLSSNILYLA